IETKMLLISPEISYNYNFFDIADNLNWKTNEVRIGTSISYISKTEIPKIEPSPEVTIIKPIEIPKVVEPVKIEKKIIRPTIISNVQASVQAEGKDTNVVKIVIEDHFSRYLYPLLSYVFFDENSSELRPRYVNLSQKDKLTFNEKTQFINSNSLIVYYNLINVIGKRLKSRPNSKITLIGCNSNTGNEKNNLDLSNRRAETIKNVLVKDWEINPENIIVESRNLPRNYSRGGLIEHEEENRRVEIYSDDFIITEPVTAIDSFKTSKQTEIKIKATATSNVEISEWKLKVFQMNNLNENLFLEVNGLKNVDSTFNWVLNNKSKLPDNESDIIYKLESKIHQTDFDTTSVVFGKINVDLLNFRKQEESNNNYIEKFKIKLIMFDHNSSEVSTNNKKIIDLICKSITPKSTVKVKGSTDYLGIEKDNKKLSENRANMIMNSIKCKPKSIESFGLGHVDLFTDKTPEARFFCRTVEVFVETPVN
ncbi:MAG: OmpA family protein, partial [Candidatus Kapabacteria bacterium]|nr:OmpA family protein [Candidatus Kapabacteria bacterium]